MRKKSGPTDQDESPNEPTLSSQEIAVLAEEASERPCDDAPYSVGYRKPPVKTQFRRGMSGNPKGRPKGGLNLKTAAQKVYTDMVLVREGEKTRKVTRLEALLRKQMDSGLKGNERAAQNATKTAIDLGVFHEKEAEPEWDLSALTDTELDTLVQICQKVKRRL